MFKKNTISKPGEQSPNQPQQPAIDGEVVDEQPSASRNSVSFDNSVETTALATRDSSAIDQPNGRSNSWSSDPDSMSGEDVMFPQLRLAQSNSEEVQTQQATMGQYLLFGFEPEDKVVVVPLVYKRGRELRDKDTQSILCASDDAQYGEGRAEGYPGGNCASCPYNQWTNPKDGGKGSPPPCSFFYTYGMYSVTHGTMALMHFKRTGMVTAKQINLLVKQKGFGNFAVELSSIIAKGGPRNTSFASPRVKIASVPDETLAEAKEFAAF